MTKAKRPKLPTEQLLALARAAAERLAHLSKDERVRAEALNVVSALQRLAAAIRDLGSKPR